MKSCQYCGKNFSRGYNLQRHIGNSCPMLSNSEEENMTRYPGYTYDRHDIAEDDENEDMQEENESDEEMSDDDGDSNTNDDDGMSEDEDNYVQEESVWNPMIAEAKARHRQHYKKLIHGFLQNGINEEEAKDKAYHHILPMLQREARNIYLEKLNWMRDLRRDPIHRKIMETKQSFINDDGFDGEEAFEAAVYKRKYLLNRIFEDDDGYDEIDEDDSD